MGDERQSPSFSDSPVRGVTIFNEKRLTLPASSWPHNDVSFAMDVVVFIAAHNCSDETDDRHSYRSNDPIFRVVQNEWRDIRNSDGDCRQLCRKFCGTLAKLVYISSRDRSPSVSDDDDASSCDEYPTVELTMVTFDAENVEEMLQYVTDNVLPRTEDDVTRSRCDVTARATGVGCVRNRKQIGDILEYVSLHVDPRELEYCVGGIGFMWRNLPPDQLLYVDQSDSFSDLTFQTELRSSGALPCIVVNMGSALTIMQVNEDGKVAGIVGGSSQGGMTFIGLGRLLTKAKGFSELIAMATRGCRQTVDLTVGDVAGTEYNRTASDVVVSSFGKVARLNTDPAYNEDDLAASLLYCIVDEMIKTVYIVAKAQQVHVAMFCGSFLTNNPYLVSHVRHKINVCSTYLGHKLQSLFLKHEGYLGAIGLLTEQLD